MIGQVTAGVRQFRCSVLWAPRLGQASGLPDVLSSRMAARPGFSLARHPLHSLPDDRAGMRLARSSVLWRLARCSVLWAPRIGWASGSPDVFFSRMTAARGSTGRLVDSFHRACGQGSVRFLASLGLPGKHGGDRVRPCTEHGPNDRPSSWPASVTRRCTGRHYLQGMEPNYRPG